MNWRATTRITPTSRFTTPKDHNRANIGPIRQREYALPAPTTFSTPDVFDPEWKRPLCATIQETYKAIKPHGDGFSCRLSNSCVSSSNQLE